ncbi:hypothetical protein [Longimicrobium sp.]|uniref:hypothetical protein n=1 Tax=Longimicrobium sp. TaxID=2029185 RepID=UPI003B3B4294
MIHCRASLCILAAALVAAAACRPADRPAAERNPLEAPPVDSARVSLRDAGRWAYRRELSADLDGDGQPERLVIVSDVEVRPDSVALWEDGHRWAVLAMNSTGAATLLYAAFVPNGFAEAAVLQPDDQGRRRVLVQERTPQQLRSLEIEYHGPGDARSSSTAHYQVESWLPGSASLR